MFFIIIVIVMIIVIIVIDVRWEDGGGASRASVRENGEMREGIGEEVPKPWSVGLFIYLFIVLTAALRLDCSTARTAQR